MKRSVEVLESIPDVVFPGGTTMSVRSVALLRLQVKGKQMGLRMVQRIAEQSVKRLHVRAGSPWRLV